MKLKKRPIFLEITKNSFFAIILILTIYTVSQLVVFWIFIDKHEIDLVKSRYQEIINLSNSINIEFSEKQTEEDSVAKYLTKLYGELSDVVHGRYNKLTNIEKFKIEYDVNRYKQFENLFIKTTNILLVLAILRFSINDITIVDKNKIFENTGVGKYE